MQRSKMRFFGSSERFPVHFSTIFRVPSSSKTVFSLETSFENHNFHVSVTWTAPQVLLTRTTGPSLSNLGVPGDPQSHCPSGEQPKNNWTPSSVPRPKLPNPLPDPSPEGHGCRFQRILGLFRRYFESPPRLFIFAVNVLPCTLAIGLHGLAGIILGSFQTCE